MNERIDPTPYSAERLLEDIEAAARLIEAPFSKPVTRRALEVFDPEFSTCVVQLKAACKSGTGVYYRFFYNGPNDLTQRALEANLLDSPNSPNVRLQAEVLSAFPGATRAGLDFDSAFGLAKVWTFTGGPVPVEQVAALPGIPQSVRDHIGFFADHGLRDVFFTASDYQGSTMNVYFGWDEACRNIEWIENMVLATGGARPSRQVCEEILASAAVSAGVGATFSWENPHLQRWCLYSLELPYGQANAPVPALPPRLHRFLDAPTLNLSPQYNVAWSFGGARAYVKLEKSYARDATHFLTEQMGGDLRHPELVVPYAHS